MKTNNRQTALLFAVIITCGVITLGALLKSGILGFKASERVVLVKGAAEKEVDADKVIWPINFKLAGNNLLGLYADMGTTEERIKAFLVKYEIPAEAISTAIPTVTDLETEQYRSQNQPAYRYFVNSSITVNTTEVSKVLKAMQSVSDLIKQGIVVESSPWEVKFSYNGLNDVKPTLIQQATANARLSAEKFASDSGSELGKIKTARQGEVSISTPDSNTPYKKMVRVVSTVEYYLND